MNGATGVIATAVTIHVPRIAIDELKYLGKQGCVVVVPLFVEPLNVENIFRQGDASYHVQCHDTMPPIMPDVGCHHN